MAVTVEQLASVDLRNVPVSYTFRDTILYALSVGMGRDPTFEPELSFVYERPALKTLPTQATVVGSLRPLAQLELDRARLVHGEQRLFMHAPLPPEANLLADARVLGVCDKGRKGGLLIYLETKAKDASTGAPIFTLVSTIFARGDGGIGGSDKPLFLPHPLPDRQPDIRTRSETRADQALLYRLNGDFNPLHVDTALAFRAGFDAPVLHGLCTYGIACRAVTSQIYGYDGNRIGSFEARFASPVYPGETIETEIWHDGNEISFRCWVVERDQVIINNGRCV